ncbi:hypothetical protein ERO13_D05G118400v2 [Gossypium hirsutum]|nr:hypothetical protein ERO13_D05G118400v2 [Gossypium hirsutum]
MKEELEKNPQSTISSSQVFFIHVCCALALAAGFWVAHHVYSLNLVFDPTKTLCLIWAIEFPVVILLFSCCRQKPEKCSYFTAIARGLLGLPVGALLNALGALALGAPVGLQYLEKTVNCLCPQLVFMVQVGQIDIAYLHVQSQMDLWNLCFVYQHMDL